MEGFIEFFKEVNAQKQIDSLSKKFKNKKVVLYGAGLYALSLLRHCDLSNLNVVGIADRRFSQEENKTDDFFGFKPLAPAELLSLDFDVIIVTVQDYNNIKNVIQKTITRHIKPKRVKLLPAIRRSFWHNLIEIIEE